MTDMNEYVYCVAGEVEEGPEPAGFHGQPVRAVVFRDIRAHASPTPLTHVEPTAENLQLHEDVVSRIMRRGTVLPMRFSTVCRSSGAVRDMLERYYGPFRENLDRLRGKVELGIKVFYRLEPEETADPSEKPPSPGEYMMRRYERYRKRQDELRAVLAPMEELDAALSALSCARARSGPVRNSLILNASYLTEEDRRERFEALVRQAAERYPDYRIVLSGPWPPYHFVKIRQEGQGDG